MAEIKECIDLESIAESAGARDDGTLWRTLTATLLVDRTSPSELILRRTKLIAEHFAEYLKQRGGSAGVWYHGEYYEVSHNRNGRQSEYTVGKGFFEGRVEVDINTCRGANPDILTEYKAYLLQGQKGVG